MPAAGGSGVNGFIGLLVGRAPVYGLLLIGLFDFRGIAGLLVGSGIGLLDVGTRLLVSIAIICGDSWLL